MRVGHLIGQFFFLSLFVSVSFCQRDVGLFHVVGSAQCVDCKKNDLTTAQAFAGLHVTIDCKLKNGNMRRIGVTELNDQGYFKVVIPDNIVHENRKNLKETCYAQLHNAAAMPCSAPNSLEASKIVFKPSQHTFAPTKTLQFSATLCTSKRLWPVNPNHPWLKNYPWFRIPTPPAVTPPMEPVPTPPVVTPPVEPVPTPPVVTPPVEPVPTPPVMTPPVEPLPPPTAEPPATTVPPTVSTPPQHPYFNLPKTPWPIIPGHP